MDHVRLHPMRPKPPRQPEAVAAGFEGKRNPRDLFTGSDCLISPAMQQAKQPFGTRLQFLARLTLNAGKYTGDQPARLAHLDDRNDCAILVQGDEGPAQVVRLGHKGTPSVSYLQRRWCHLLAARPIASLRWRKPDANRWSPWAKGLVFLPRRAVLIAGHPEPCPPVAMNAQKPDNGARQRRECRPKTCRRVNRGASKRGRRGMPCSNIWSSRKN